MRTLLAVVLSLLASVACAKKETVVFETTLGTIKIRCLTDKAPLSCQNFFAYVDEGFYVGTVFHRVIPGFMIQGGGFSEKLEKKPTREPIKNEADNGLRNKRGTLSMARTMDPDSATSQFFVNVVDNPRLDHTGKNPSGWGYAVFAEVVEGMEVVDKIKEVPTLCPSKVPAPCQEALPPGMRDVPATPVVITRAFRQ